jgi:protein-S-isoprenylcysteine O-methyltransferase Ste14
VIGELHLFGLFAPASLVSAILAGLGILIVRRILAQTGFYRLVWHPGLFDLALYVVLWGGAAILLEHLQSDLLGLH